MAHTDYFIEVFPIEQSILPAFAAYAVNMADDTAPVPGSWLAWRFSKAFAGRWAWLDGRILTDEPALQLQVDIALNNLREHDETFQHVDAVVEDVGWQLSASAAAEWVLMQDVRRIEPDLRDALKQLGARLRNAYIKRDYSITPCVVDGLPALSLSVSSLLVHDRNLQQVLQNKPDLAPGLCVVDRLSSDLIGTVSAVEGHLADRRDEIIALTQRDAMKRYVQQVPDDEYVVQIDIAGKTFPYPASALLVLIRTDIDEDWQAFNIDAAAAVQALQVRPDVQAKLVRSVSDVLKQHQIITQAFNSRSASFLFHLPQALPDVIYGGGRVRPYEAASLANEFVNNGLHTRHPRFDAAPIKIAFINTLDNIATDFMEALRRQIERDFDLHIDLVKERNVRVVNEKNLMSAVRAVEKEAPQIVLAFLPDPIGRGDAYHDLLKSQSMGKGIASHTVYESTMNDPNAMANVIMGILSKTGNIPYLLAEPLSYTDYVVGLDLVREQLSRGDRVAAMARIYRNDGAFVRYIMDYVELDTGEDIPFVVLQKLFPDEIFERKTVIVHHAGVLPPDMLTKLSRWAQVLNGVIHPVEILRDAVPRLYSLADGITQPPRGTTFALNPYEAFIAIAPPQNDDMPAPLHVRVPDGDLGFQRAVASVLAWTLLHYNGDLKAQRSQLPVTIQHVDDMVQWMARGVLPENTTGNVPFWL